MKKSILKRSNGITLIALIITIIVLVILAVVVINSINNDGYRFKIDMSQVN